MRKNALNSAFLNIALGSRGTARAQLAELQGVGIGTIYAWEKNRHPVTLKKICITEKFFKYSVTRFELRPDAWNRSELKRFMRGVGQEQKDGLVV